MSVTEDAMAIGEDGVGLKVLASGSTGNCSVLLFRRSGVRRVCLLDLGLSPRRTFRHLAEMGLGPHSIDDAILTHLDVDHCHAGWRRAFPRHATLHVHRKHRRALRGAEFPDELVAPFEEPFAIQPETTVDPILASHDEHGVAALRFDIGGYGEAPAGLGFATDVGAITDGLVQHLLGVDVLAIESNYCPRMQIESDRPEFLKRRIMGGKGHLSNQQSFEAVQRIRPRSHVVLLHLSQQCNLPELAAGMHKGADYRLTVTSQTHSTEWIKVAPAQTTQTLVPRVVRRVRPEPLLFQH